MNGCDGQKQNQKKHQGPSFLDVLSFLFRPDWLATADAEHSEGGRWGGGGGYDSRVRSKQ